MKKRYGFTGKPDDDIICDGNRVTVYIQSRLKWSSETLVWSAAFALVVGAMLGAIVALACAAV